MRPTQKVVLAFGTRPEATKMAPVYRALGSVDGVSAQILLTGQHQEQLTHALKVFGITGHVNLDVMTPRQSLTELLSRIVPLAAESLRRMSANYVLVHGDTLSTFAVAMAAFLERIPVGHVEAGLRSHNMLEPFPEEANRRLTDVLTDLDLAPTDLARQNLLREGKREDQIVVTGQTGIDAILMASRSAGPPTWLPNSRIVTVTLHRRENWPILSELAKAIARLARRHPATTFVYPVHLNPAVRESVSPVLAGIENVLLTEPLEYAAMASLLARSHLIVTDSGGLQEEGAALGVPVVVVRNVTERPEGLTAGKLVLAGASPDGLYTTACKLLCNATLHSEMRSAPNPYGDGRAATRVAQAVAWRLGLGERPSDWQVVAPASAA